MDILEIRNLQSGFLEIDLKVKRSNRTTIVVYGSFVLTDDISTIDVYHNTHSSANASKHFANFRWKRNFTTAHSETISTFSCHTNIKGERCAFIWKAVFVTICYPN